MYDKLDFYSYLKSTVKCIVDQKCNLLLETPLSMRLHTSKVMSIALKRSGIHLTSNQTNNALLTIRIGSEHRLGHMDTLFSNSIMLQFIATKFFGLKTTFDKYGDIIGHILGDESFLFQYNKCITLLIDVDDDSILSQYWMYCRLVDFIDYVCKTRWIPLTNIVSEANDNRIFIEIPAEADWYSDVKTGFLTKDIIGGKIDLMSLQDTAILDTLKKKYLGNKIDSNKRIQRIFEISSGVMR